MRIVGIEAFKVDHSDPFDDFGIDPLGFFGQQATVFRRKLDRLSTVEFGQLFFEADTFGMEPFSLLLLLAVRQVNQPCLQPFEHDDPSCAWSQRTQPTRRHRNSLGFSSLTSY